MRNTNLPKAGGNASTPLSIRNPVTLVLLAMAAAFGLLGLFFVLAPRAGAEFFGLPVTGVDATFYVRALGIRDAALAIYIALLTLCASRHAVFLLLVATPVIPVGDMALLFLRAGSTPNLLLHLLSAVCFASMAAWVRAHGHRAAPRSPSRRT